MLTISHVFERIDALASSYNLSLRNKNTLRLLGEEMFSLASELLEDSSADFHCSCTGEESFELHLTAPTLKAPERPAPLAQKEAPTAFGKMRGVLAGLFSGKAPAVPLPESTVNDLGLCIPMEFMPVWTLNSYFNTQKQFGEGEPEGLERSILVNTADDVMIGVRNGQVELMVQKSFL